MDDMLAGLSPIDRLGESSRRCPAHDVATSAQSARVACRDRESRSARRAMGISHVVMISAAVGRAAVERVRADLVAARAAGEIAFDGLELGRRIVPQVRDGMFAGPIDTGDGAGDYVLVVALKDAEALQAYYQALHHSIIRQRFLSAVSPEIAALYAEAAVDPGLAAERYEAIERCASQFMKRLDLSFP